jgi:hypothetical protein
MIRASITAMDKRDRVSLAQNLMKAPLPLSRASRPRAWKVAAASPA